MDAPHGKVGQVAVAAAVAASILLMAACAPDVPRGSFSKDGFVSMEEVTARDDLIAAQDSMLNAIRCRFDIDTHAVPGGCINGNPGAEPTDPPEFTGVPNLQDLLDRDELIRVQESLLNHYRCEFDTDTDLVPGGCASSPDAVGASQETRIARVLA